MNKIFFLALTVVVTCTSILCSPKQEAAKTDTGSVVLKTEEQKMVDVAAEKINMNPQNSGEYCESKDRIQSLDNLATSSEAKHYVSTKQEMLLQTLKRYVDEITIKEGRIYMSEESIKKAAYGKVWKERADMEIVQFSEQNRHISNKDGIFTMSIDYLATVKKNNGLFRKDSFISDFVRGSGRYILTCKGGDPIAYTAKFYEPDNK